MEFSKKSLSLSIRLLRNFRKIFPLYISSVPPSKISWCVPKVPSIKRSLPQLIGLIRSEIISVFKQDTTNTLNSANIRNHGAA